MLYKTDEAHTDKKVKLGYVQIRGDCFHETKEDDGHPGSGTGNRHLARDVPDLDGLCSKASAWRSENGCPKYEGFDGPRHAVDR